MYNDTVRHNVTRYGKLHGFQFILFTRLSARQNCPCDTRRVILRDFVSIIEVFLKFNSKSHCVRDTSIFSQTTAHARLCDGWSSRCKYNADCIMQFEHALGEKPVLLRSTKSNLQFRYSHLGSDILSCAHIIIDRQTRELQKRNAPTPESRAFISRANIPGFGFMLELLR